MLATDFVLHGAVLALQQVFDGQLRLDRTIEVSVTNTSAKRDIMRRLGPNLQTLRHMLAGNQRDFYMAINKSLPEPRSGERPGSGWFAAATRRCGWSRK